MKSSRLWVYRRITWFLPETRFWGLKTMLLRWCGATVGMNVRICSSAIIIGNGDLSIGDDVWIGSANCICPVSGAKIEIGSHCDLGPQVMILTGSHRADSVGLHVAGEGISADAIIGEGCWLGARALVLPGVKLARKTLVAAGSVVTSSVACESMLIAGVPAKEKRKI